jgi:hypothetical protein
MIRFQYLSTFFLCLALTGALSCASDTSRNEPIANAYADMLRFRDVHPRSDSTTVQNGIDSILSRYGLTQDSYLLRFRALADDPTNLRPFFELVQNRLAQTSGLPPAPPDPATD